ncbi:MAG TPA: laccase domain-containing protein [Actinobacteria bacterium]|nr:laccase domain-containing protein [Actinomycetota bacterium]
MIRPPGFRGVAFTTAHEGDALTTSREAISVALGIPVQWATVNQVHGSAISIATIPGDLGDADGIATRTAGLPIATFTADCFGVVLEAEGSVGVVHAGWRGTAANIVSAAVRGFRFLGDPVQRAAIGPGIQSCCFEVGQEVAETFGEFAATTSWQTRSVDLQTAIGSQLGEIEIWKSDACTRCGDGFHSHRGTGTDARMAAVGWLP